MKTTILLFTLLFATTAANAQENNIAVNTNKTGEQISTSQTNNKEILEASELLYNLQEMTCYSEISKVTFYEALIRQNNFDIELKDSKNLVLKNTEDIINNRKDRVSYSD